MKKERESVHKAPPPSPLALTDKQRSLAIDMLAQDLTIRKIADHFEVSHGAIWRLSKAVREKDKKKRERRLVITLPAYGGLDGIRLIYKHCM